MVTSGHLEKVQLLIYLKVEIGLVEKVKNDQPFSDSEDKFQKIEKFKKNQKK